MLEKFLDQLMKMWPTAAMFLAVVIGGLIASSVARRMARWAFDKSGLDALAERAGAARLLYAVGIRKGLSHVVGSLIYAAGLLVTGAAAADLLGLDAVSHGVAAVLAFLPRLAAAAVVFGAGVGLAGLLRRLAVGFASRRGDVEQPELLGNLAYYGVMTLSVVVAAQQAGIETALIESLLVTLVSITCAAIALAFALGSRESFHNLVAGHFLRRLARPGDTIRFGGTEGVVVRYFGVAVVVKTSEGELAVPCRVILDGNLGVSRLGARARAKLDDEAAQAAAGAPAGEA